MQTLVRPLVAGLLVLPALAHAQLGFWQPSAGGNGHYYEAVASPGINWSDANSLATSNGGYLAAITSKEENIFIYCLIKTNAALWIQRPSGNRWGPWIGGFQPPGSAEPGGGWSWVTGEPFAYANWNAGEPSNDHGIEDRIHFWGERAPSGEVWNDKPAGDTVNGFVIEYDRNPNAVCLSLSLRGTSELQIAWRSRLKVLYTVEWVNGFCSTNWDTLTNVVGNGGTCSAFDRISSIPRFYRVLTTP